MKDLQLSLSALKSKAAAARTDIRNVASLKAIVFPKDGDSFMVDGTLYIWMAADTTLDNGQSCLACAGVPASVPGRFRVPKMLSPLQAK
jgi:hypothetical protein